MKYDQYSYILPPRTELSIPSTMLTGFERKGWCAQVKKNGTNSVIFVSPERKVFAKGRHDNDHKQWEFTDETREPFTKIPGSGWWVFNAELLHSKTKGVKNTNALFDVLVADGKHLIGWSYLDRYNLLYDTLGDHLNEKTAILAIFKSDFKKLFDGLKTDEDEGLMLKNPSGLLSYNCGKKATWMVKCRRSHKNFGF